MHVSAFPLFPEIPEFIKLIKPCLKTPVRKKGDDICSTISLTI